MRNKISRVLRKTCVRREGTKGMVCVLIFAALFLSLVLFVYVVAALFFFGGLNTHAYLAFLYFLDYFLVLSLRRDLNKNSSNPVLIQDTS